MTASVQWLCPCRTAGLVRVHAEGGRAGDPYTWAAAFVRDPFDPEAAVLVGVVKAPTPAEARAAIRAAKAEGFRKLRFERGSGARVGWHAIPLGGDR